MTHINLPCPVCNRALFVEPGTIETYMGTSFTGKLVVFCGYGPCPSHVTNDGGEGATEKEAYGVLCRKVEEELMQNDEA